MNPEHESLDLNKHVLDSINILQQAAYEEAFKFWECYLETLSSFLQAKKDQNFKKNFTFVLFGFVPTFAANCLVKLNQFDKALVHLNQLRAQPLVQQRKVDKLFNIVSIIENPDTDVNPEFVIW